MKQWTLRILVFGLLSLGIVAGQILVGAFVRTGGSFAPPMRRFLMHENLAAWGEAYLSLRAAPEQGMGRHLLGELNDLGVQAWVFDRQGREIAGREVPKPLRQLALKAMAMGGRIVEEQGSAPGEALAAATFRTASGMNFVAAGRIQGFGPPPPPPSFHTAGLILSLICAGLLLFLLLRRRGSLVREMRQAFRRLAQGDVSARMDNPPAGNGREFEDLAQEFNAMADTLHATLQSQHRCIAEIIHDMHSPLTRLTLAVEMTNAPAGGEAKEMLERIRRDSRRLAELSDRLLVLSRKGGQGADFEPRFVDLTALAEECVESLRPEARSRGRDIQALLPDRPLRIQGDKELLLRAMENGLRNALDYTPRSTAVHLELSANPDAIPPQALLRIRDHGPGVDAGELGRIFRPFYRAANAKERPGDGLGLAIVQRAALLHGGEARAENSPDGGLILTLRLALESAQGAALAPKDRSVIRLLSGAEHQRSRDSRISFRMVKASGKAAAS